MVDLDELARLEQAATPGPWAYRTYQRKLSALGERVVGTAHPNVLRVDVIETGYNSGQGGVPSPIMEAMGGALLEPDFALWFDQPANAAFIAASRNALPALLALARAGERLAAALTKSDEWMTGWTVDAVFNHGNDETWDMLQADRKEIAAALAAWRAAKEGR